jgi:hypothetical protein
MGTRCTPHLAVPVLYSDEADFMQKLIKDKQNKKKHTKILKKNSQKTTKKKVKNKKTKQKQQQSN